MSYPQLNNFVGPRSGKVSSHYYLQTNYLMFGEENGALQNSSHHFVWIPRQWVGSGLSKKWEQTVMLSEKWYFILDKKDLF